MKLSIAWIFDHIDVDWKKQDIKNLVKRFNQVTAEIDDFYKVEFDLKDFALAKVLNASGDKFKISIPEWDQEIELPGRKMSDHFLPDSFDGLSFFVKKDGEKIRWAQLTDFNVEKDGLLAPVMTNEKEINGAWKNKFEGQDIILEVDNKSITHRPDMWGHRGFAREIAAFLDLKFLPESKFLKETSIECFDKKTRVTSQNPISIEIKNFDNCKRFAGTHFNLLQNDATDILMFSRILKVGSRPINSIIDLTNYLMLDWGQPVHAYDADKIEGKTIIARMAKRGEKLDLLEGTQAELTTQDLVIADNKKPVCLAGIVGGVKDSVGINTKKVFLEAANFDAACVRRSAMRHKVRTESSSRFEKTLDKNQTTKAIQRFLFLAEKFKVKIKGGEQIVCVGQPVQTKILEVKHEFFERRAGFEFSQEDIIKPLRKLEFQVDFSEENKSYQIKIPSFRASKDVEIKEDILEEVIRFYGFENIKLQLPKFERQPHNLNFVVRIRKIKRFLAHAAKMTEQQNYIFYDDQFINSLDLNVQNYLELKNPVSDNLTKLITSLIPGLFKNIKDNFAQDESLHFFELGRIWIDEKDECVEQQRLSGIIFEKRKSVNFYEGKNIIEQFLNSLGIDSATLSWERVDSPKHQWFRKYQTANIYFADQLIGIIGCAEKTFLSKLDVLPESDAFIFDLDGDFLLTFERQEHKFVPLSKFQETTFDFSIVLPFEVTTKKVEDVLWQADKLVRDVELIDYFEKKEWIGKRSLTFRVIVAHPEKTLEKQQIDSVWNKCVKLLKDIGAELRS